MPIAAVRSAHTSVDPHLADRVFSFGDAFEAVAYQLSFSADARNADAITKACGPFLRAHADLEKRLSAISGSAAELATELLGTTTSAVTACNQPATAVTDDAAEAVQLDFGSFREMAFDFSQLVARQT